MLEGAAPRLPAATPAKRPAFMADALQQLTAVLLAAVLLETLLLRLVVRVGVHVPREGPVLELFHGASLLGSLAFNFASLLAIVLVVLVLGSLLQRTSGELSRAALAVLLAALLSGLALTLAAGGAAADALFGLSAALLAGLIGLALAREGETTARGRLALALMVGAYFSYQYYALGHLLYRLLDYPAAPPLGTPALRAGEVLAVAAAVAAFAAWGLPRWRQAGRAGLAGVAAVLLILAAASLSPASTLSILALWTTGLSLFLPFPVYLLALGLYLTTLVACWRSGDAFWTAAGLLLVLLAGYMPEATYQHLLLLLGVAFLSGVLPGASAERAPAAA